MPTKLSSAIGVRSHEHFQNTLNNQGYVIVHSELTHKVGAILYYQSPDSLELQPFQVLAVSNRPEYLLQFANNPEAHERATALTAMDLPNRHYYYKIATD